MLRIVASKISDTAHLLTQNTDKKTLSYLEIKSATLALFPAQLGLDVVEFASNAVSKYTSDLETVKATENTEKQAPKMRETRAGLIFSVSFAEKYVRCFGQLKSNVGSNVPVFLAGVLQFLTQTVLNLAYEECIRNKKKNISNRNVFLAVKQNEELDTLFENFKIVMLGCGVQPHIHEALLNKVKKPLTKKRDDSGVKKPHRWRPGTLSIKEIRAHQKGDESLIQHAPFERLVRHLADEINTANNKNVENVRDLRFTEQFLLSFQELVEGDTIEMLNNANELTIFAKRETVQPTDIDFVIKMLSLPNSVESVDDIENDENNHFIPYASISKLGYRAGVKRMGLTSKNRIQAFIRSVIKHYLYFVMISVEHNKRKTINTKFLIEAVSMSGRNIATVPEKKKTIKKRANVDENAVEQSSQVDEEEHYEENQEEELEIQEEDEAGNAEVVA
jgi:histone H3